MLAKKRVYKVSMTPLKGVPGWGDAQKTANWGVGVGKSVDAIGARRRLVAVGVRRLGVTER